MLLLNILKRKIRNANISLLVRIISGGTVIAMLLSLCGFSGRCEGIRSNVLRLHIIANSDSEADQALKLLVRDAVQNEAGHIFDNAQTLHDAEITAAENEDIILNAAKKVINENGFDYGVKMQITQEYFETRTYEYVTLPAGNYTAVKLILGEGKGKNWWCVLFPCMCVPAAQESAELSKTLDEGEISVVCSNPQYEVRFKVVEWFQSISSIFS